MNEKIVIQRRMSRLFIVSYAFLSLIVVLLVSGCVSSQNDGNLPAQGKPELRTLTGTMVIADVEFADRFPPGCSTVLPTCSKPVDGRRILIVWLEREDNGSMEEIGDKLLEETKSYMLYKSYVTSDNGAKSGLQIVHRFDTRFALVFVPNASEHNFKLTWPDNQLIDLGK